MAEKKQVAVPGIPLSVEEGMLPDTAFEKKPEPEANEITGEKSPDKHFQQWLIRHKGGPGSGNKGHKGVPGHLGGSAPGDGMGEQGPAQEISHPATTEGSQVIQPKQPLGSEQTSQPPTGANVQAQPRGIKKTFRTDEYSSVDVPTRLAKWEALSIDMRDEAANARQTVPFNQRQILSSAGERPTFSGDVKRDLATRLNATKHLTMPEAHERIVKTANEADDLLAKLNVDPKVRHQLGMEIADALVAQENEAMTRQLGDHGIHHIQGNIENANLVLSKIPGQDSDRARAAIYVSQIFHDTGYLTEPSRLFMDEGHKRWSAEHYDENIRPVVEQALGKRGASDITHIIRTHDDSGLDWESDPVASAVRVADNMSLFHREKLPPVFRVKGNLSTLIELNQGRISVEDARARMIENINGTGHSEQVKSALSKGANEVSKLTGKYTLGMLGGYISGVSWTEGHIKIQLTRNKRQDLLNKILDLGQKQFGKFAKSYKVDPAQFLKDLAFKFPPTDQGRTLLEAEVVGIKERKTLRILYGRYHRST